MKRANKLLIIASVLSVVFIIFVAVVLSQAIKILIEREKSIPDIGRVIDNLDRYSEKLKNENVNAKILEDGNIKYLVIEDVEKIKNYFTDFNSCDIEFSGTDYKGYAFEGDIYISNMKDSYAKVDVTGGGGAGWCGYNKDNFEEPIPDPGEYIKWDKFIKSVVSVERLKSISSKASMYT